MEKYFALIQNDIVESVIIGSDEFISSIQNNSYQYIIDVTERERPSTGDSYYSNSDMFVSNNVKIIQSQVDDQEYLHQGTEDGFTNLQLSRYVVNCQEGIVTMDCKRLDGFTLLDALHKFLEEDAESVGNFFSSEEGLGYGKFYISWEDAQILHDALKQVRF